MKPKNMQLSILGWLASRCARDANPRGMESSMFSLVSRTLPFRVGWRSVHNGTPTNAEWQSARNETKHGETRTSNSHMDAPPLDAHTRRRQSGVQLLASANIVASSCLIRGSQVLSAACDNSSGISHGNTGVVVVKLTMMVMMMVIILTVIRLVLQDRGAHPSRCTVVRRMPSRMTRNLCESPWYHIAAFCEMRAARASIKKESRGAVPIGGSKKHEKTIFRKNDTRILAEARWCDGFPRV